MYNENKYLPTFVNIFLFTFPIFASDKEYSPIRLNGGDIIIDGLLEETIWDFVGFRNDFIQREPIVNENPCVN
ncbi:MAG: hypothetical protein IIB95_03860 [Candidatus Marinimicrobia bacterium]|nr:hypothetical protein [Candidatus Neomarinimicrobiota bacterium]MCH7762860.1 hypothetical protein [Candidatus Neomarinimicrobiota bacterium]